MGRLAPAALAVVTGWARAAAAQEVPLPDAPQEAPAEAPPAPAAPSEPADAPAPAAEPTWPTLSLDQALASARLRQPQLRQARAATAAARARADEALAPLLPQITAAGSYQRTTANFAPRPGLIPSQFAQQADTSPSFATFDYWNFSLTATQLLWDFGQTSGRYAAARTLAESQAESERAALLQVELTVRSAYFAARARRQLVGVARRALANQDLHLRQTEGFVSAGTRPAIDLVQARSDRANALVQLINAQNDYETSKAMLNQAMGIERSTRYDVQEDVLPPVDGEDAPDGSLVAGALSGRPELAALAKQRRAGEQTVRALQGGYGPSLALVSGVTEAGTHLDGLVWNWQATANLTWPIFQGGLTRAQVREARANLEGVDAQLEGERLQVRLDVEQARLGIRAAKSSLGAVQEAAASARERLRLAQARYLNGAGNAIELGDAQAALVTAEGQQVQAEYQLATARARLLQALGRNE